MADPSGGAGDGATLESVGERHVLTGWGRTAPSACRVVQPACEHEVRRLLDLAGSGERLHVSGVIGRGLGRSYGDAAQCAGGLVLDTRRLDRIGPTVSEAGLVDVGAGVTLEALIAWSLPRGWFVPVTPGTRQVTVGGAIAADIHGKNHHRDGSFGVHVVRLALATPTGTVETGPDDDGALFWATVGGMGMTGIVVSATLRLIPVESSWIVVDTERYEDLDAVMAQMESSDAQYRYSVAWLDCMARGARLGRSVLTRGAHAAAADLAPAARRSPLATPKPARLRVPVAAPPGLLNAASVAAFNELWYRKAPRHETGAVHSLSSFFHPLDAVADWNLLYGPNGLVQYQFAVGPEQGEAVRRAVTMLVSSRVPSFLGVLKRFGPGDPGPLSFPMEGWTLALDFPLGPSTLPSLLDRLDELVAGAGGRIYLAKDARLAPGWLATMYPRIGELAAVRSRIDPHGVLRSDLARRLGMDLAMEGDAPHA